MHRENEKHQSKPMQPVTRETLRESGESGSKYGPKRSQTLEHRGTSYDKSVEETVRGEGHSSASLHVGESGPKGTQTSGADAKCGRSEQKWNSCSSEIGEIESSSRRSSLWLVFYWLCIINLKPPLPPYYRDIVSNKYFQLRILWSINQQQSAWLTFEVTPLAINS